MRRTQRDRVLELLSDGGWRSTRELVDGGGGLRVPSRVDELRKQGFSIECRRSGGADGRPVYLYRLVSTATSRDRVGAAQPPSEERSASPRPVDECMRCGKRAEVVDADALYCAVCVRPPDDAEPVPPARADGQLVLDDRAMRRQAAA